MAKKTKLFTPVENEIVKATLTELSKNKLLLITAVARYGEERKYVDGSKAKPFLHQVLPNPWYRGLSRIAVQLINVAAAQDWEAFQNYLKRYTYPQKQIA